MVIAVEKDREDNIDNTTTLLLVEPKQRAIKRGP
jgi:hypothetical protein